jgi:peptidoglycan/LPS O-acetylase OafA/YrhL
MKHRSDIDGLRAVAVLAVVFFHARVPGASGGFVGVDIFFVISGYLISSIIATELRENTFSLVKFYERRCRRILPALFVMFALVFVLASAVLLPPDMVAFCRSLLSATFFVSNIYFWRTSTYFEGASQFKPLLHTWSLGVEEQFYIVMPLVLMLVARRARGAYAPWLLLLFVSSLLLSVWGVTHAPNATFYVLPTRFWELTTGALVTLGMSKRTLPRPVLELVGAAGLGLCVCSITLLSEVMPFPGWYALIPCLGAAAILYQGALGDSTVTRILSAKPLVFIGQISYSLYLWHWPLLSLAKYEMSTRNLSGLEVATVLAAGFLVAVASWRYVERPFRANAGNFDAPAIFKICAAASVFLLTIGLIGIFNREIAWRYPGFVEQRIVGRGLYNSRTCFLEGDQAPDAWRGDECFISSGHQANVMLWGDSFAAHYAPGIAEQAQHVDVNILQYTAAGCAPVFGYYSAQFPHCRDFNEKMPDVLRKYNIRTVVIVGRWESLFTRGVTPQSVGATVKRLNEIGVRTYVIGQSPVFNNVAQFLFAKQLGKEGDARAAAPLSFDRGINSALEASLPLGVFIDPLRSMCEPHECDYRKDGQFLVIDAGHLSAYGSGLAVKSYFPFVTR